MTRLAFGANCGAAATSFAASCKLGRAEGEQEVGLVLVGVVRGEQGEAVAIAVDACVMPGGEAIADSRFTVFENVSFTYPDTGIQALKNVSFRVRPGDGGELGHVSLPPDPRAGPSERASATCCSGSRSTS